MTIMRQVVHARSVTPPWSRHAWSSQQLCLGSQAFPSWVIRCGLWWGEGMVSVVVDCGVGQRNGSTTTMRPYYAIDHYPLYLLSVSTSFLWRQTVVGTIVVQSGQLVAHALAVHGATHGGHTARTTHRHPQYAQPVAPVRQRHGRRPRLPSMGFPEQAPHRDQGQPWGRTREETRHHRFTVPRDAIPTRRSSFRLFAMASPHWMLVGSD